MNFAIQMGLSVLGLFFVIWLRAVLSVKASEDTWDWRVFLGGNMPRFLVALIGVFIVGTAAYFDAAGLQSTLERFDVPIQGAVGFGMGSVIGSFVLLVPDLNKFGAILLIGCLGITTMACPWSSSSSIEKAYNTAEGMYVTVEEAANNVLALFDAQIISYELKEAIIAKLRQANGGTNRFKALVDGFYAVNKASTVPGEKITEWDVYLNSEVVKPISDILVDIKVLSPENQKKVLIAIVLVRQAIMTLVNVFVRARGRTSINFDFYNREKELLNYAAV